MTRAQGARRSRRVAFILALALATPLSACGASGSSTSTIPRRLLQEERPIGTGRRFHPPATGPVLGRCRRRLGPRFGAHVEVFAADRVVILPAGIGTMPPRRFTAGRLSSARCYGSIVTLDPTGVVYVRRGERPVLSGLFRAWGQPLSRSRLASFSAPAGQQVVVFIDGRHWPGPPGAVALVRHAEIVLEVGPRVPPHSSYTFPPGA